MTVCTDATTKRVYAVNGKATKKERAVYQRIKKHLKNRGIEFYSIYVQDLGEYMAIDIGLPTNTKYRGIYGHKALYQSHYSNYLSKVFKSIEFYNWDAWSAFNGYYTIDDIEVV